MRIDIKGLHEFAKQNAVTIIKGGKSYDVLVCQKCGLRVKRYGLSEMVDVDGRQERKAVECSGVPTARKIEITKCNAFGRAFTNLTPGSTHDVVSPPRDKNNSLGLWVMGATDEPVLVLHGEFKELPQ